MAEPVPTGSPAAEGPTGEASVGEGATETETSGVETSASASGGVDSTYLADVAVDVLGDKAVVVIADSPSIPRSELAEAIALAEERDWNLHVVSTREFDNDEYLKNDGKRCYHCKGELFKQMRAFVAESGAGTLVYGAIVEDALDPIADPAADRVGRTSNSMIDDFLLFAWKPSQYIIGSVPSSGRFAHPDPEA